MFGQRHEEEFRYGDFPDDIREAIYDTLEELRWRIGREGDDYIEASIGISLLSYGEKLSVDFIGRNTLLIRSNSIMPLTVVDWGKNKTNVRRFIRKLEEIMDEYEADYE